MSAQLKRLQARELGLVNQRAYIKMADAYTWIKNLPDIIKSYWPAVVLILGSSAGNIWQHFGWQEDKEIKAAMVDTITLLANKEKSEKPSYASPILEHERKYHQ